jgi:hypothetical protein
MEAAKKHDRKVEALGIPCYLITSAKEEEEKAIIGCQIALLPSTQTTEKR